MLAVQKPVSLFSASTFSRPSHSRHPSAPAVVRPTPTPGLLSLSKPSQQPSNRPQQTHQYGRAPRSSPKNKPQRSAPAIEGDKKAQSPKQRPEGRSDKASTAVVVSTTNEKLSRGRQPKSTAAKDKADRRSPSTSPARTSARRLPHQPSPPPTAKIPQQTNTSARPMNSRRPQSFAQRDNDTNSFDLFMASSGSETESTPFKTGEKHLTFQAPPTIASQPSGKLARRRHNGQVPTTPTPKAVPVSKNKHTRSESQSTQQARSLPSVAPVTPKRPASRRVSTGLPLADWDDFPICDDSLLTTPFSATVRESASAPPKQQGVTWQQTLFDDGPHTAPLSSTFAYPFATAAPFATPSPAQRRRNHRRVPSEGVFAMSMDEDSSSDSSDESKIGPLGGMLPAFNPRGHIGRTPSPPAMEESPAAYFAGSVFQNSPSPDELPVPAFRA